MTECHAAEVDVTVITAHPAGNHQFGAEADEPTVGIAVRRTCLTTQISADVVSATTQSTTRTFIDDRLEHVNHLTCLLLRQHLVHARGEVGDDIAVGILDARDEQGRVVDTHAGEDGVGTCHLADAHVTRTQRDSQVGLHGVGGYLQLLVEEVNEVLWTNQVQQIHRSVVVRVGECRLQRHHTQRATLRCPSAIVLRTCIHIVARGEALAGESQRVEQGFDGRTHLTVTRTQHVVVGKVVEVQAWHVSLHLSVLWVDGNGACTQELLIVDDGIARTHPDLHLLRRVVGTAILEHTHIDRRVECLHDFLVAQSVCFHHTIAFTPAHIPVDDLVHLLDAHLLVRTCLRVFDFVVECRLQILRHMLEECLFRHLLHAGVDGGVDLQAVRIDIIM